MDIRILGTGCPKCKRLEAVAREAIMGLDVDATLSKVTDVDDILSYDVMMTPGLVIDGEVRSAGRVPRKEEIQKWIMETAGQ